jgi:predicted SAM-dependent methyltransferase
MYEQLKQLVPKSFIEKHKPRLRQLVAMGYAGSNNACNVCGYNLRKFVTLSNSDKICPNCGSLPRTRRLWQLIQDKVAQKKVLHFSPPQSLQNAFRTLKNVTYVTTDYAGEFNADKHYNIENISELDHTYDIIICYHVLEHICNDQHAMKELYRILKPGGTCYIQTPFKSGEIYEDDSIISEEDRLIHFGQEDHVRIYSVDGLCNRLTQSGFKVTVSEFKEASLNFHGYKPHEFVIQAVKPNS